MAGRARCEFAEQCDGGGGGMTARKICVVTSTRAEYGLLFWLLKELQSDPAVDLQLIATGTHLSEKFGMTVQGIEADGFTVNARVPMSTDDDSPLGITKALASVTSGVGEALDRLQPDIVVLLGDRFEILGAAQAALIARIPIAHIHGGESTEGLIDEAVRHSVTKMAHLHFVAANEFRHRVMQLGENPQHVWTVGASGLDNIARLKLMDKSALEAKLNISLKSPFFLFTFHPVTLDKTDQGQLVTQFLSAMVEVNGSVVITGVNADTGSKSIRSEIAKFADLYPDSIRVVETLGSLGYLSAVALSDAVVGNSSSGLLEAPALGVPTIDIGDRQRGRLRAPSVIHCNDNSLAFKQALQVALSDEHKATASLRCTPYGTPGSASRISKIIRDHPLDGLLFKKFYAVSEPFL